jgi:hypothetical protein
MKFILAFLLAFFTLGCGTLNSSRDPGYVKRARAANYDPYHIQSCGPEALKKAFARHGVELNIKNISHKIQTDPSCSNLLRDLLSVFHSEARQITFPAEMKKILKKKGFTIVSIRSLKQLNDNKDTAIILIKKRNSMTYHWVCFPVDKNIESFFGKGTIIKEIYLIKK